LALAVASISGVLGVMAGTASAAGPVAVTEASQGSPSAWNLKVVSDPSASGGAAVAFGSGASLNLQTTLSADADTLTFRVRGDQCGGAPAYSVTIDGAAAGTGTVGNTGWTNQTYTKFLGAGTHTVTVAFTNYSFSIFPSCTRKLYLDDVTFTASPGMTAPSNPAIPAGFVHQSGTQLLDGAGNPLRLRGVDLGGWLSWEGWIWGEGTDYTGQSTMLKNLASLVGQPQADQFQTAVDNNYITGADFHAMSADGFNVARLPFNYRLLEDDSNPFVYKQSGWDVLDQAVAEAKANNVYLVLDMHAAPCSQTYSFTADYVGPSYLWSSQQCRDRYVALWKAIAARYANDNVIAGYDLLNEPMVGDQALLSLYKRVTAAVRQVDPNHLLIYEGNNLAKSFTAFTTPLDPNEMLSFHDYSWSFTNQDLTARMPGYDAAARAIGAPIWAGEFGQDNLSGISHYVSVFNGDPLIAGWADWTWKQSPGLPAMQTIQLTPAARTLFDWMNNTSRTRPTPAQATQGMSDFINAISFANTVPNAQMQQALTGGS
jgi:aryl-phospho-beta-D-glucosidase BglC (GH1 family)